MRMGVFQLAGGICFWMAIICYWTGDTDSAGGFFFAFILNIVLACWIAESRKRNRRKRRNRY